MSVRKLFKIIGIESPQKRFSEYLTWLGMVAEYKRDDIPKIIFLLRQPDRAGFPPDLARAVLGGFLFMSGRLDELFTEVIAHLQSPLSAEEADLLARTMVVSGQLEQAKHIYRGLDAAGFNPYATSRLAALAYAQDKMEEADDYYTRFCKFCDLSDYDNIARDFLMAVEKGSLEFDRNIQYWQKDGFSDSTIERYRIQLTHPFKYCTTARHINECSDERLYDAINHGANIRSIVNYGAFYGLIDAERAVRWPNIQWMGVDRDATAIAASTNDFTAPNLTFMVADEPIEALRRQTMVGDAALIHTRTGAMMTPRKLSCLYEAARSHGFRCIIGSEFVGENLLKRRYFNPQTDETSSACTSQVFNHNYKKLLHDAGYTIIQDKKEPIISYYGLESASHIGHIMMPSIYSFYAVAD